MHKRIVYLIALVALLTACGGQAAAPTPTPTQAPPTPVAATATASQAATPKATGATLPDQPTSFKLDPTTACQPAGLPEAVPGIPPVGPDDWIKGSPDAPVTLMEYGDYQ